MSTLSNTNKANDYSTCYVIVIILILLLVVYFWQYGQEHLNDPWFLNQMAMLYPDHTYFNYFGRSERDVSGMAMDDYYLENQINSETGVGPQYLEGDQAFSDKTGYMTMPIKYRPLRNT